ncbi:MAG: hypothetical protein R3B46_03265 [Phycisphaerales bacterium]|nr:hypothetical protein [Phycisphaerales bacterium]
MNSNSRYQSARLLMTAAVAGVMSFATLNMVGCDDNDTPGEAIDETGDAIEEVGEDIEDTADDVGDEIDDAADDAKS